MAGSVTVQGLLPGSTGGTVYIGPFTLVQNGFEQYEQLEVFLVDGANTITVPQWVKSCLIVPVSSNTVPVTFKGVTGDTGTPISPNSPTLISFPVLDAATSFVLTTTEGPTDTTTILMW